MVIFIKRTSTTATLSPAAIKGLTERLTARVILTGFFLLMAALASAQAGLLSVATSAATVTGGVSAYCNVNLTTHSLPGGTAVNLQSSSPDVQVPTTVTVPQGYQGTQFKITTSEVSAQESVTITANIGSSQQTTQIALDPIGVGSLTASSSSVQAGTRISCAVSLASHTIAGQTISLSSNSSYLQVPASVSIRAGFLGAQFYATTSPVSQQENVTITASFGGSSQQAIVTLNPYGVSAIAISPGTIAAGASTVGKITLAGPASTAGEIVSLSSDNPDVIVPATVTVAPGFRGQYFQIESSPSPASTTATITATVGSTSQQAGITIEKQFYAGAAWPKSMGNTNNSGVSAGFGATPNIVLGGTSPLSYCGIALDNAGYACYGDEDGYVWYYNMNWGLKWQVTVGGAVRSSIALGSNGDVYFGAEDYNVYALSATDGSVKWTYPTGGVVESSPTIGPDGTVYIGSSDDNLYALNGDTGALRWVLAAPGPITSTPVVKPNGNIVFTTSAYVIECDPGGSAVWYSYIGALSSSPVLGSNGLVYVLSQAGNVYAYGDGGGEAWEFDAGEATSGCTPALDANGTLYFGCADGSIYAVNSDGSLKWRSTALNGDGIQQPPVIASDGTVYFGSIGANLYAVNPATGGLIWTCPLYGSLTSPMSIDSDGTIYFFTADGSVNGVK